MKLFSLILVISLLLQLWMPWWTVMAVPFAFCLWKGRSAGRSFLASFLAVFLLWFTASLFIHIRSGGLLSQRVSELLHTGSPIVLVLLTAVTGGLAAGTAGWTGFECRRLIPGGLRK
ncbi:MAG TPA: hypothetical protein VD772_13190 [Anseongella sp.]|nr:hypothetical protein [Anseongella sp.]